jgi:hypothetical protein
MLKISSLILITLVLGFSISVFADVNEDAILKKYSIEELWDMSTLLAAAADEVPKAGAHCSLDSKKAFALQNPLQALIDAKKKSFVASRKKSKTKDGSFNWGVDCKANCRCGLYSSLYENVGYENLSRADQVLSKKVTNNALNQDQSNEGECAGHLHALCGGALMRYLNQDVKTEN